MTKKNKIIIGALVGGLAILLYLKFKSKAKPSPALMKHIVGSGLTKSNAIQVSPVIVQAATFTKSSDSSSITEDDFAYLKGI